MESDIYLFEDSIQNGLPISITILFHGNAIMMFILNIVIQLCDERGKG